MSYVLQRCVICNGVIDLDDPDYKSTQDDSELCDMCNVAYEENR
jgi:hypothetical protein